MITYGTERQECVVGETCSPQHSQEARRATRVAGAPYPLERNAIPHNDPTSSILASPLKDFTLSLLPSL
jgi:hypothetical protein